MTELDLGYSTWVKKTKNTCGPIVTLLFKPKYLEFDFKGMALTVKQLIREGWGPVIFQLRVCKGNF